MKQNSIFLVLLLVMGYANAQYESFFGRQTWSYDVVESIICYTDGYNPNLMGCSTTWTYSFDKSRTVTVNDTVYYRTPSSSEDWDIWPGRTIYLREDSVNGRLFGRYEVDDYEKEYLICDLSLSVGDTFTLQSNSNKLYWFLGDLGSEKLMRVDSITYPSGKKIIYLTVLNDHDSFFDAAHRFNVSYRFMEGVGPMLGIFPHERNDVSSGFLLCMHKDEELFYMTHEDLGCYQQGAGISNYSSADVHIYPNPTSQDVTIEFATENEVSGTVIIRDIVGRVCKQAFVSSNHSKISVADLPSGIYILTFADENMKKFTQKIVKY